MFVLLLTPQITQIMKKIILISFMIFATSLCFSQNTDSRRLIASTLSSSLGAGSYCTSFGDQDLLLVLKGESFDSYMELIVFMRAAGWSTFKALFDDYGFLFICFKSGEIDKCYSRTEINKLIYG